jgi:hypothetical protein
MSTPLGAHTIGHGAATSVRSSPVKTASTPGCALAAVVSIETIRAWASGERTIAAYSMPGITMSST